MGVYHDCASILADGDGDLGLKEWVFRMQASSVSVTICAHARSSGGAAQRCFVSDMMRESAIAMREISCNLEILVVRLRQ